MKSKRFLLKRIRFAVYLGVILFVTWSTGACCDGSDTGPRKAKTEILSAEEAFENMAATKGIAEAFAFFADDSAVILRNDTLIRGREAIRNYYAAKDLRYTTVRWTPGFAEVSAGSDLGYTYGNYVWTVAAPGKDTVTFRGVFHTVWKRQADGTWRYVWD